jgi:hypothetical protein
MLVLVIMFRYNLKRYPRPPTQKPKWKQHLDEVNLSYTEHFIRASTFSLIFAKGSFKSLIHGLLPGFFEKAATKTIKDSNKLLNKSK